MNAPYSHAELLQALAASEREVGDFFGSLAAGEFVQRPGDAWSPSEHLEHLSIAVSAVARGLEYPKWLLWLRFGRARRASRTYVQLREDYRALLAQGGRASGRFVPGRERITDDDDAVVRRTRQLSKWYHVNGKLQTALKRWSERDLDRIRLPHPLLGRITARELVLFTIYHGRHHIDAATRRIPRLAGAPPATER